MEAWKRVWRQAIVPLVSLEAMRALYEMLQRDDPFIIQGATTRPPPLQALQDWECEGMDALTYMLTYDGDLETVGEVEEAFARACFEIDQILGEPAGCRHFLNAYDDWPRNEMRRELMNELPKAMEIKKEK